MVSATVLETGSWVSSARLRRVSGRLLSVLITLFGLLFLTFSMGRLLPADPVLTVTGAEVDKQTYERVYTELGLDRPVWEQFAAYVGNVLHGDLGRSTTTGHSVVSDLLGVFPATIELAVVVAVLWGVLLGVPLGIVAAANRGRVIDPYRAHRGSRRPFHPFILARFDGVVRVLRQVEMGWCFRTCGRLL